MISSAQVTVDSTADLVAEASTDTSGGNGYDLAVSNRGSVAVYLGDAAVSSSIGFQLDPGASVAFWLGPGEALYGITVSGSARLDVLRVGA